MNESELEKLEAKLIKAESHAECLKKSKYGREYPIAKIMVESIKKQINELTKLNKSDSR